MPVPPVMKTDKIAIIFQDRVVSSIQQYTRTEKSQLEYLLIFSIMKFIQPSHGYLGYKGIYFSTENFQAALHVFHLDKVTFDRKKI